MNLKPLDQQVVAVVGATSGIGRATALRLAKEGAKLIISGRSDEKLIPLKQDIQALGGEATTILADVSIFEQVKAIGDRAIEVYGRLDTWVHVPGVVVFALFEQTTPEEFRRVIDVNLMGQAYGAMVALPLIKREGRGALIHISSVEGLRSIPYQSSYSASKHGVEGFLESLRVELMHEKLPIGVTSIKPAVMNTPLWNNAQTKLGFKPRGFPPYYSPELVAEAVVQSATHVTRDYYVGDVGRVLAALQRLSPELVDALLLAIGFGFQLSDEPKSPQDPNNVYETVPQESRIDGDFTKWVVPSLSDWLAKTFTEGMRS
jgi:NAD(P)-dependent dehydrogenase (short-subunit alcohol dehydrogenase family)